MLNHVHWLLAVLLMAATASCASQGGGTTGGVGTTGDSGGGTFTPGGSGGGSSTPCQDTCNSLGERVCTSSTQYITCEFGADSCKHFGVAKTCGAGQICEGGECKCVPIR